MAPSSVTEGTAANGNGHLPATHRRTIAATAVLKATAARLHETGDDPDMVYRLLGRSWSRLGRALAAAKRERLLAHILSDIEIEERS